jgi:hypothetical protein
MSIAVLMAEVILKKGIASHRQALATDRRSLAA